LLYNCYMGRLSLLSSLVYLVSCGGNGVTMPPPVNALCTADLTTTGMLAASATPDPTMGCQPDGTWTFTAKVATCGSDGDCNNAPCMNNMCSNCTNVPLASSYTMTVTGSGHNEDVTNPNAGSAEDDSLQISGDNDSCNGSFDLIIPDNSQYDYVELNPTTGRFCPLGGSNAAACGSGAITGQTITISGPGEYELFAQQP
jgi:hypothetical protein